MKRMLLLAAAMVWLLSVPLAAQNVLKEPKAPTIMKYLVDASPQYSTLVKAINAADLTETMEQPGPMTLFAPSNKAFEILPAGTVENWLKPETIDSLQKVLTYHVIAGNWPISDLEQKIKEAGGEFFMPTIGEGGQISFMMEGGRVVVKDKHGFKSQLLAPVTKPNGMVYAIDKLLLP